MRVNPLQERPTAICFSADIIDVLTNSFNRTVTLMSKRGYPKRWYTSACLQRDKKTGSGKWGFGWEGTLSLQSPLPTDPDPLVDEIVKIDLGSTGVRRI
jgi:hypothetical protein